MTDTTIAVSDEVKEMIREHKRDGEKFNGTLARLADAYETEGERWTEDEIRSMARAEAKDMIRQYGGR